MPDKFIELLSVKRMYWSHDSLVANFLQFLYDLQVRRARKEGFFGWLETIMGPSVAGPTTSHLLSSPLLLEKRNENRLFHHHNHRWLSVLFTFIGNSIFMVLRTKSFLNNSNSGSVKIAYRRSRSFQHAAASPSQGLVHQLIRIHLQSLFLNVWTVLCVSIDPGRSVCQCPRRSEHFGERFPSVSTRFH